MSLPLGTKVRSTNDGQLGEIVAGEDGQTAVKLDRSRENLVVPYRPNGWRVADEPKLGPMQVARVAYEADRALRLARSEYGVPAWDSLREQVRIDWMRNGPPKDDERRSVLFRAVLAAVGK